MDKLEQLRQALPMLLFLAALIAFVTAGFLINNVIGLVVLGACLLVLGWILSPSPSPSPQTQKR